MLTIRADVDNYVGGDVLKGSMVREGQFCCNNNLYIG